MSRVFLAEERALGRRVVVKVLAPELAEGISAERFRREIQLAARLQHPHIVPLLAAAVGGELLYYTMPFVDGESLRARLDRDGLLPLDEVVAILRDVTEALAYAHSQGVVHRDIKPENVLLAQGSAVVTDFGIAKAITSARTENGPRGQSSATLTQMGMSLGTPRYMAPEQAAGDPSMDHRADLYTLGVVAYEMLTGAPPFVADTVQGLFAAHIAQEPVALDARRPDVPTALVNVVMHLLAKRPEDRPQTADEVLRILTSPLSASLPVAERKRGARRLTGRAAAVVAGVITLAVAGSATWWWTARMPATALDDRLVVVAPFRVSGADPSLGYLREGMIDLLAAKLTSEGGPRAVSARSVLVAWRRRAPDGRELSENDARQVATTLGSGKLLLGDIVGTPARLVIHAALLATASGRVLVQESVEGPPDSIASKIDQLVAKLLSLDAGQRERLAALSSASLPALRAYLDGKTSFRHGQYGVAKQHFARAAQLDSTFALAVLGVLEATFWGGASGDEIIPAGMRADAIRARLSEKDRAYLAAMIGPRFPEYTPMREFIDASERAAQLAPDQPETWSVLGDWLFHVGGFTDVDEWEQRARMAYRRALAIDSTFAPALGHFVILAARRGDTATVRTLGARFIATDSVGETAQVVRWRRALMLHDAPMLADIRGQLDGAEQPMDRFGAYWIFNLALHDGVGLDDGDRAAIAVQRVLTSSVEHMTGALLASDFILERGQPRAALAASQTARAFPGDPHLYLRWRLLGALYAGGDSAAANEAVAILAPAADASPPRETSVRSLQNADRCLVEQWRIMHGDTHGVRDALARMRSATVGGRNLNAARVEVYCAILLDALAAEVESRPDAVGALDRLDSLMRLGPNGGTLLGGAIAKEPGNLIVAWLRERHGDLSGALRALRRVGYVGSPVFVSVHLREEGRMAALSGDRAGAMRAFRHYLAIRSNPEPALRGEADAVRNALTLLERGQPPAAYLRALSPPIPRLTR